MAAQLPIWYATPSGSVERRFAATLVAEWQVVINRSCNYERPLIFSQVVLTKVLGIRRARGIWKHITRRINLWERGLHAGLVGEAEAEGADMEGRPARGLDEEDKAISRIYHSTVMSGKLSQAFHQATNRYR